MRLRCYLRMRTGSFSSGFTYDRKESLGPGWLESTPPQCCLADIQPCVCRSRIGNGEASSKAVESTSESYAISLPVHTQLFHRPARARALVTMIMNHVDGNNNSFRHSAPANKANSSRNHGGLNNGHLKINPDTALLPHSKYQQHILLKGYWARIANCGSNEP